MLFSLSRVHVFLQRNIIAITTNLSSSVTPTTETPVQFAISVKLTGNNFTGFLPLVQVEMSKIFFSFLEWSLIRPFYRFKSNSTDFAVTCRTSYGEKHSQLYISKYLSHSIWAHIVHILHILHIFQLQVLKYFTFVNFPNFLAIWAF